MNYVISSASIGLENKVMEKLNLNFKLSDQQSQEESSSWDLECPYTMLFQCM